MMGGQGDGGTGGREERSIPIRFEKCPVCGQYGFSDTHHCPPYWEVAVADDPEDVHRIYAIDAGIAAEIFVGLWDDEGVIAVGGGQIDVIVTGSDGSITKYTVDGTMVPRYDAYETVPSGEG